MLVGDEIVNVNGRRLRGLPMTEAKDVLRGCSNRDVDIVVARNQTSSENEKKQPIRRQNEDQPLSLLANHDEQDLINLSSVPLRPGSSSSNESINQDTSNVPFRSTIIRIGKLDELVGVYCVFCGKLSMLTSLHFR